MEVSITDIAGWSQLCCDEAIALQQVHPAATCSYQDQTKTTLLVNAEHNSLVRSRFGAVLQQGVVQNKSASAQALASEFEVATRHWHFVNINHCLRRRACSQVQQVPDAVAGARRVSRPPACESSHYTPTDIHPGQCLALRAVAGAMADVEAMEVEAAEPKAPADKGKGSKSGKRFEIKKWNAVAMWSWAICTDTCAICRNNLYEPSIEYQANPTGAAH